MLKTTKSGTSVLELNLAISVRIKRGDEWVEETSWLRASLFGRRADSLARMLHKGDRVGVTGALLVRTYETREGGKGTSVELVNADIHLIGSRDDRGGQRERAPSPRDFGGGDFPDPDEFGEDIPFARCDTDTRRPHDPTRGVL